MTISGKASNTDGTARFSGSHRRMELTWGLWNGFADYDRGAVAGNGIRRSNAEARPIASGCFAPKH